MYARTKAVAALALVALLASTSAFARSSDRRQPMDIEGAAFDSSLSDNSVTVFTGGVTIRQGSLDIRATRAEVSRVNGDPSRAVLTGAPVRLSQQLDDGTPMSATAARVDYDLRTEIVVFTGGVNIQQPRGTLNGDKITYNMRNGQVAAGATAGGGRVKMRILPRNAQGSP
ncbi:lipopolysaccharide transport periplasmic protein LptA [Lysobacter xanthus]